MIPESVFAGPILLRPWREDEGEVYRRLRDGLVFRFTTESPEDDGRACADAIASARRDPNRLAFAVCDPDGEPVGHVGAQRRPDHAELSYWLAAPARGRGWATRAVVAATDWVIDRWDSPEVWLEIDPDNQPSIRVAVSAGFRRRGLRLESACGGPALVFARRRLPESTGEEPEQPLS